jgi:nickel transport protein
MAAIRKRFQHNYGRVVLMVILSLAYVTPVQAHKLNIFAFAESGKVLVDSYFVDGSKAKDSKVKVSDASGKTLVEGMTDKQGHYEFPIPGQFDLKISVDAGMGHRAEWLVPVVDLGVAPAATTDKPQPGTKKASTVETASVTASMAAESSPATAVSMDTTELQQVVNKAVSEAVLPLVRSIEELKQHDSLTQIIGSIGYIFGVFGVWIFLKSRRENPSPSKEKPDNDR